MSQNRQIKNQTSPFVSMVMPSPVMGWAMDCPAGMLIAPHYHDDAQLIYAASGVITVETDDGLWVVPPARAVWVPAGITHSIEMSSKAELRLLYIKPMYAPIDGAHCCVVQVSALLRSGILRVIDFLQPYPRNGPETRLVVVIFDEIRAAEVAPLHLPMPGDPRARRVAQKFRENPADRRSREAWAQAAHTSERTLERLFHAQVGTSFGKWQQQARLLKALQVLAAGETVTNAALEVGFKTPSAFINMFRRSMVPTPAHYFVAEH
ncbi:MAG: helix-turn-helix transcriptional regulator [Pseudomonadota bacterium]